MKEERKHYKAHSYQEMCTEKILSTEKVGLFLECGLGKTAVSLDAIRKLKEQQRIKKVLIIAPRKVAESSWQSEIEKFEEFEDLKYSTMLGTQKQRIKALETDADVYIINRDNVKWLVEYCKDNYKKFIFDMVVVDESSSFKSHKSQRFKALKSVRDDIRRIVLLTGTPCPRSLSDIWSQVYLLDTGERLEKSHYRFMEKYFTKGLIVRNVVYRWDERQGARQRVMDKIKDICISLSVSDVADSFKLEDYIIDNIIVKFDKKTEKEYKAFKRNAVLRLLDENEEVENVITTAHAAALNMKLQQYSSGAIYDDTHNWHEVHNCKIEALLELVERLDHEPLLIFYQFKSDKERILKALEDKKIKVEELKDAETIKRWNNKEIEVLLAHPASCCYGLNLQEGGHHICWFSLTYNLEQYLQANARLHRQGQKDKVIIHQLIADRPALDFDIERSLRDKNVTQQAVLNSLKAEIESIEKERK